MLTLLFNLVALGDVSDDRKPAMFTVKIERFSREQATAAIEALGAKVGNSVSSKTTGLFVGEEPGASKLTKARKAEVPLLTEDDLVQLLDRG